jgi:hypothetical protein
METVRVYGASDDLIEVEGPAPVSDEFSGGEKPKFVGFSDGTVLRVVYADDGCWRVTREVEGAAQYAHTPAVGADDDNYSDVATLIGGPFTRVKVAGTVKAANIGQHANDPRYATLMAFAAWINDNYDEVEAPAFTDLVDDYIAQSATP